MSSYWKSDDVIRIGETSVSIPSENGLSYTPGQKISLYVPPSVKFMSGKDCYLEFDVKVKLPAGAPPTRLQLDHMGGSACLRNMRIWDGTRGNMLEEINDYNAVCAIKYDYDTDDSLRGSRALTEGGTCYEPRFRGTTGTSQSHLTELKQNPYFKALEKGTVLATDWADTDFTTAKCCCPIHSGVFGDKIFPVLMTQGLYLEWDLAPAQQVLKQMDSVSAKVRLPRNPFFDSIDGDSASNWTNDGTNRGTAGFYVSNDNNLAGDVSMFPFVVGETFRFARNDQPETYDNMTGVMTIAEIENPVGSALIRVKLTANVNNPIAGGAGMIINDGWVMVSTSACGGAAQSQLGAVSQSYGASYTVSNFNLVVQEIHLDPSYEAGMLAKAREGKSIELDIYSVTNHKHSVLSSERQVTYNLHANNSRAKSLVIMPTDSTVYASGDQISGVGTYQIGPYQGGGTGTTSIDLMDRTLTSVRTGYTGICDALSSSQFLIGGVLVPSRPVSTKKMATRQSIDAFHLFELEKALGQAGVDPRSFAAFQSNFLIGRSFGLQSGVQDIRNKDLQVLLRYEDSDVAPTKNKVYNNFVYHVRKLIIRNGAVQVEF